MINSEEINFFEALSQIIRSSGLRYVEIARRGNRRHYEQLGGTNDPAVKALMKLISPMSDTTVSRAARGIDSISELNLKRIALGLDLDDEIYEWLRTLWQAEQKTNWTTSQSHRVKAVPKPEPEIPAGVREPFES